MNCKYCNAEIGEYRFCTNCGADNSTVDYNSYTQQNTGYTYVNEQPQKAPEKGRALASMILGICSLVGVGGIITAILALVFSKGYTNCGASDAETYAKVGKITGIISLVLNILAILAVIAYIIFIIVICVTTGSYMYPEYYYF